MTQFCLAAICNVLSELTANAMNPIKKCRVCGDIARGFNYDGLSCESCKVFFCRNSLRFTELKCRYNNACEISTIDRKCLKCRLAKCFAIGMKRKVKVEENCGSSLVENVKTRNGIDLMLEISIIKQITSYDNAQIAKYISNQRSNTNIQEYKKKRVPLVLNLYELECLAEAQQAISVFPIEANAKVITRVNSLQELIDSPVFSNLLYIKKTINFCQHFAAFNSLSSEDQLVLLKAVSFNLMEIKFIFQFDLEKDGYIMYADESETEAIFIGHEIDANYKNQDCVKKLEEFGISLHNVMESDVNIRDLISTIVVFKSSQNLSCPENIRYQYHLYCTVLQRYLQHKYQNKKEGNQKFLALMRVLDRMDIHYEQQKRVIALEYGVENMPTIVKELYDLK